MLVYSASLAYNRPEQLDHYFAMIARWVSRKTHSTVTAKQIRGPSSRQWSDVLSTKLETWIAEGEGDLLHALRFTHGDSAVRGRLWSTELGLRAADGNPFLTGTVLLETREVSTLVTTPVELRPPRVVRELVEAFGLHGSSPGATERSLTEVNASDVQTYDLLDSAREHAAIIVSPTSTGDYLLDCDRLRQLVVGLADVWRIPATADTWAISRLLTAVPAPYNGAVTIIFPRKRLPSRDFVPSRILTGADLELYSGGPELHVLELLAHRSNLPMSWRHISPDRVRERVRSRSFQDLKNALMQAPDAGAYNELFATIAEDEAELRRELEQAKGERDEYWYRFEEAEDQLRRSRFEKDQLEQRLSEKSEARTTEAVPASFREAIAGAVLRPPTVSSALCLIELLFPERVLILPDARKSAEDHDRFQFAAEAFGLLYKLADEYWHFLATGVSDAEARKVFGRHEFAAKEGDLSKTARRERTFTVPGAGEMLFEPHLKIQRGPNEAGSWRCHFEWLADKKRLVIGHCGVHLSQ